MAEEWLTYQELALRLDKNLDAARKHVLRAGWPRRRGEDGRARVLFGGREEEDEVRESDAQAVAPEPAEGAALRATVARLETELDALHAARASDAVELERLRALCDEQQHSQAIAARLIAEQKQQLDDMRWEYRDKEREILRKLGDQVVELVQAQELVESMLSRDARYLTRGWFGRAVQALPPAHDERYAARLARAVYERLGGTPRYLKQVTAPQSP